LTCKVRRVDDGVTKVLKGCNPRKRVSTKVERFKRLRFLLEGNAFCFAFGGGLNKPLMEHRNCNG
jgi:hypothetical protein